MLVVVAAWLLLCGSSQAGMLDLGAGVDSQFQLHIGHQLVDDAASLAHALSAEAASLSVTRGDDAQSPQVNKRASASLAVLLNHGHYGLVVRGRAYDNQAWSQLAAPESTPDLTNSNRFAPRTALMIANEADLQEAYLRGHWGLGHGLQMNMRAGRQTVGWSQSVFSAGLVGLRGAPSPAEAAMPGVQLVNTSLAVDQVSINLHWSNALRVSGYYRLDGGRGMNSLPIGGGMNLAGAMNDGFLADPVALGRLAPALVAVSSDDFGRWGAGLQYQLGTLATLGGYFVRYDAAAQPATPGANGQPVGSALPGTRPALDLYAASLSTHLGPIKLVGQANFRDDARRFDADSVASCRVRTIQTLVSATYTLPTDFLSPGSRLTSQAGYVHLDIADAPGIAGPAEVSLSGFQSTMTLAVPHLIPGWNASFPVTVGMMNGQHPASLGQNGLTTETGIQRVGLGARFRYMQHLVIGVGYSVFLGAGHSNLPSESNDSAAGLSFRYTL